MSSRSTNAPQAIVHKSRDDGAGDRRREIWAIAARLFARKGYRGTSMRDIGEAAGVLGGSLYHHIKSKDALFVALHDAALDAAAARIDAALAPLQDPWARLEQACETLLEIQLDPHSLTLPMMNDFREVPDAVRADLIARRDRFETLFRDLVAALPLPPHIDRSLYRNLLLSQLNSAADWYRPGRLSPRDIARQIATIFRHE
ncbi:TetR/AcrR family transcriptional regulator [Sphingobium sp. CR2-8]|uniref:TetR/AcrR family transcriptional regulator n=1 Tax=Sphingobium sp. CR2-8 TaxID=1306534 RepID=UPI002DBEF69F|nr:TetR/AcrR family transcriptional regulator [Sphingobium sp. CR2-8]MEC3909321.1 TetR/AcrR family transcriptional regulator [Sphingobium sp. CR2-8]